jgi:hypothetical protein
MRKVWGSLPSRRMRHGSLGVSFVRDEAQHTRGRAAAETDIDHVRPVRHPVHPEQHVAAACGAASGARR